MAAAVGARPAQVESDREQAGRRGLIAAGPPRGWRADIRTIAYRPGPAEAANLMLRGASMENDLTYFQRRASQERVAALHAAHPRARQAHLDMAREYDHLIRRLAADERGSETYTPPQGRFLWAAPVAGRAAQAASPLVS